MRLRILNSLVYAFIAVVALAVIARPLRDAFVAITAPWSYAPGLVWPWLWPALAAGIALTVASIATRLASRHPVGIVRYGLLLALAAISGAARRGAPAPTLPSPGEAVSHLLARVEAAANEGYVRDGVYPVDASVLEATWPERLREMGYRGRGAVPLRSRVHVRTGALDPVFRPPPGTRPGDIVYAVDELRGRYWVTAFVLDRTGRLVAATGSGKKTLMGAGREGRPANRLDPLFPEYPNKAPMAPPQAGPASGAR